MSESRPAYVIGHVTVKDKQAWAEYREGVPATLVEWGGELVLRGKRHTVWDGTHHHTDTVVLRFASLDAARRWHDSAAYQALIPLRHQAADVDLILFEG
ncbi:MAG TPA: DUF1330 domain-containing protein [Burkholderiaceae bacterium]|nr:DUF1330 domain-containing protein [Burkholderiaceae bacterium]